MNTLHIRRARYQKSKGQKKHIFTLKNNGVGDIEWRKKPLMLHKYYRHALSNFWHFSSPIEPVVFKCRFLLVIYFKCDKSDKKAEERLIIP